MYEKSFENGNGWSATSRTIQIFVLKSIHIKQLICMIVTLFPSSEFEISIRDPLSDLICRVDQPTFEEFDP